MTQRERSKGGTNPFPQTRPTAGNPPPSIPIYRLGLGAVNPTHRTSQRLQGLAPTTLSRDRALFRKCLLEPESPIPGWSGGNHNVSASTTTGKGEDGGPAATCDLGNSACPVWDSVSPCEPRDPHEERQPVSLSATFEAIQGPRGGSQPGQRAGLSARLLQGSGPWVPRAQPSRLKDGPQGADPLQQSQSQPGQERMSDRMPSPHLRQRCVLSPRELGQRTVFP